VGVAANVMQLALFVAVAAAVNGSVHAWLTLPNIFHGDLGLKPRTT